MLDFLRAPNVNQGVQQFLSTPNAVLLDVREADEYAQGRIPKSRNLPLSRLPEVGQILPDKDTPLFVYCLSGGRSRQAVGYLRQLGYRAVTNIGGIGGYQGKVEKG